MGVNRIYGGLKNLTTFLTTSSPLPHHPTKNLTTFGMSGEVSGEVPNHLYVGGNHGKTAVVTIYAAGIYAPHHLTTF